jgi:hypothetical protein
MTDGAGLGELALPELCGYRQAGVAAVAARERLVRADAACAAGERLALHAPDRSFDHVSRCACPGVGARRVGGLIEQAPTAREIRGRGQTGCEARALLGPDLLDPGGPLSSAPSLLGSGALVLRHLDAGSESAIPTQQQRECDLPGRRQPPPSSGA